MRSQVGRGWPIAVALGGFVLCGPVIGGEPPREAAAGRPSAAADLAEADRLIEAGRTLRREPGKAVEAEAALTRALEIRRAVLGPDDPAVARALDDLGSAAYNRGQYAEAEALYRQAIAIAEKALGPRNLELAGFLGDLGAALREAQKFAEAEQTVQRSLSIRVLLLPKDDPAIAASLDNLGRNYVKQGRYPDAREVLLESVRIYEKAYGADGPRARPGKELLARVTGWEAAPPPVEIVFRGTEARLPLALNSGASVSILSMGPLVSPEGWAGLVLAYETALPLDDTAALRREVDEIWQHFIIDVAKARYGKALIVAKAPTSSTAPVRPPARFLFTVQDNGWCTAESPDRIRTGLDADFVRDFIARYDWLIEHSDGLAASLYLAPAWHATLKVTEQDKEQRSTLDRNQFVATLVAMERLMKDYEHRREIIAITVDPDGKSAKIESREIETVPRAGEKIKTESRSVDVLQLVDDHVQLIQSFVDAIGSIDRPL